MRSRHLLLCSSFAAMMVGAGSGNLEAEPYHIPRNDDGSVVTAIVTAEFDPANGVVPFPTNLLFQGTTDLTLNIPVADPSDSSDPRVAMNALDGFSTVAPWSTTFSRPLDPASVVADRTVRFFEVSLASPAGGVTGIVRRLRAGRDWVPALTGGGRTLAIVPLRPLDPMTTYMAVMTRGLTDEEGNNVTPSQTYFLAKRTQPFVDEQGNSTEPLLENATARSLEPLRQLVSSQEAALSARGLPSERIALSWTATTQSTFQVLGTLKSVVEPAESLIAFSGTDTSVAGLPGIADIYAGRMEMPYYLDAPTSEDPDPTQILDTSWESEPGGYVPPFDAFGLDPTSTNVTAFNPFPRVKAVNQIPVLVTVPNDSSSHVRPPAGWPVAIYQHGITRNRGDALAVADTLAQAGFAVVSIDLPLHGVTDQTSMLYAGNLPDPLRATERTFDVDLIDNQSRAPGPDGNLDPSGAHFINLSNLLNSRDNLRQGAADLSVLAATIPTMDVDQDGVPDFDGSRIHFVGQSLGAITGIVTLAVEEGIDASVLSAPGGGIPRLLENSETFGPAIRAGLQQAAGLEPGTPDYEQFFVAAQTVVDSADPINFGALAALGHPVLLQEVIGSESTPSDRVVPNAVPGVPLSGTEPLIRVMGLDPVTGSTLDPDGVRGAVRFLAGSHGSLLDPTASPAATVEMQTQMASMLASDGNAVQVDNPSLLFSGF